MTEKKGIIGIAHIYSTKNSTIVHITDLTGTYTFARYSSGMMTDKDREGGKPYPAILAAKKAAEEAIAKGVTEVYVRVRGKGGIGPRLPGLGAVPAIRTLIKSGLKVKMIEDVTPIPHGYMRRTSRRGRRV
ncbi:MAG: 30S ribosomal protein S11 [Candidatus Aenigmatarchaeota archaeon]